ncbi:E3 ubiquitin/ISG15 ligase TRIM25-like isoform X3 [Lampris incognitus]|uniref:E3 ubiquitin/ISG15 ligase TRIM25-like isoform X3 n=1 Tax=Lampris incognitus TaxID=2546036 RepID=UPI0024B5C420|nr:E3 ubiquitin/ISG15 ligase TRIM25-like isoform X3 [Lampris incognitus]XP_056132132.1 E3 ubiquitin/ISG15 ligase TRIM25-like isoform X3 [Lampris incognitus]
MAEQQQQQQQQQGLLLDRDQLCCSICLDLLNQPVTLHCGHSYCRDCIESCWGKDEEKGVYSCPQCRQTFSPRPALVKNTMLAQIVENLKTTGNQQASPSADVSYAGPTDVACNFCIGTRPHKALMTCSVCLASYCSTHLQPHYTVPVLKKHKLVSVTARLQEKMCFSHDKLMEVYCRTDQQCICYLCIMHEHKGHDTVSAEAERAEIQKQLGVSRQKAQQRLQEREKEIKKLRQAVEDLKSSAQTAVEDSERIFTELMASIERRRSEVKELIRAQEKTAVSQIEELLLQLEEEMEEWRRSDSELEQLSHTDDHIHFIQITDNTRVCSKHFTEDCFRKTFLGLTKLKPGTLPTIFPWSNQPTPRRVPVRGGQPAGEVTPESADDCIGDLIAEEDEEEHEEEHEGDSEVWATLPDHDYDVKPLSVEDQLDAVKKRIAFLEDENKKLKKIQVSLPPGWFSGLTEHCCPSSALLQRCD